MSDAIIVCGRRERVDPPQMTVDTVVEADGTYVRFELNDPTNPAAWIHLIVPRNIMVTLALQVTLAAQEKDKDEPDRSADNGSGDLASG